MHLRPTLDDRGARLRVGLDCEEAVTSMSVAEARAAGLLDQPAKASKKKTRAARGTDPTVCHTCGLSCPGETAERRHNEQTGHARFEWPL